MAAIQILTVYSSNRGMVATVPIYLSEISAPQVRGLIGGISGCGISLGTMMSNWVGFACGYAPYGATQWRLPLGIQIPWGIILFIGLATFMPNSPRQLIRVGKVEDARREFMKIRRDLASHEVQEEFALMHAQIVFEQQREIKSLGEVFKLFRHRALVYAASPKESTSTSADLLNTVVQLHRRPNHDQPHGSQCHSGMSHARARETTGKEKEKFVNQRTDNTYLLMRAVLSKYAQSIQPAVPPCLGLCLSCPPANSLPF